MTPRGARSTGLTAVVLGVALAPVTGGVTLLLVLGGAAALVVGARRQQAVEASRAEELLVDGRVQLSEAAAHDEGTHLRTLLDRARGAGRDPDPASERGR